ncbi:TPA: hypothetical protein ENX78_17610, partial [Candidatus Poribacteria bacterium]|nr:hypothetical protein [Candidatus Poribacteria bacterium]
MRSCFLFIALSIIISALFLSCGMSNKTASEITPMIVVDGGAGLYDGNDLIGNLPAGTEVGLIEKRGKWCLVEVQVEGYNMKVKGLMSPESLAPAPENASIQVVAPAVSPVYEPKRKEIWADFFTKSGVNAIALDGEYVWAGTTNGLVKFPASAPNQAVIYTTADGLLDNDVLSVDVCDGEVWIGTSKGLNRFNGTTFTKYTTEDGLLSGAVMAISAGEDYVWLGLDTGIARFDKTLGFIKNMPHSGGWSPESGSGSVSLADKGGIYADTMLLEDDVVWNAAFNLTKTSIDGRDIKTYSCGEGLIHSRVIDFSTDPNNLWIVTLGGITKIDRNDDTKHENFYTKGGYELNPVISACRDGKYIWIVTKDGLSRFDTVKQKFNTYFACWDLFKGGYVSKMKADDKYLWIATTDGLWRMDKAAAEALSDRDLVDDFESPSRIAYRGWNLGKRGGANGSENLFIDYTIGANNTSASLCNQYVAPDYKAHSISHVSINLSDMDLTDYDGVSFFIKADPAVVVSATASEKDETWIVGSWHVPKNWM